jgi:hypothetical protein
VLHRDIKPSNIMMRRDGEPVLMDFGIAKAADEERDVLTMTGDVFGTVEYMAPEQARSSRLVDERGDVYSLGAVLYQMVTGRKHFVRTGNLYRDLHGLESSRIIRPRKHRKGIEQDFEAIILKALAPEPVRRYRSARHFHEDLRRFLTGEPVHAKSPTPLYVLSKKLSRHRHAVVFSLAAAVLLTVLVGYTISQAGRRSGRWATVAHHSFTPKSSREGATDTAAPLRVGMSPVWFEDARAAGEVRLRLTFRPVRRGWALRLLVNAPVHDDVERPMPGGYVCSVSDSGGGTLEITTGERAPPRLGAATSLSLPDRSALVVGFDHQDDEVCAWIEGAPPLRCLDPLPPFGPHLSRIGIWCPRGNVDVLEIDVRHRTLPREVTPLVAGDALFAAGEMRAAAAGYRSVAEAYAGSQLAEKALVRGMVALLHHPACGWREKHLHELRAVLGQRFPHSRYWPSLEHMVRSSVVSEVAE